MKENRVVVITDKNVMKFKALKEFGDQTSFHGFRFITEESFPGRRLLWLLLILTCIGALVYQIVDRVIYYRSWPVTVNVGVNYNTTLQFPAVTICNQNAFKASLATENGWYEMIEDMYTSESNLEHLLHRTDEIKNITLEDLYLKTAHKMEDFIFSCSWKGIPCKEDDFKKILTDHGVCFTWNSNDGYVSSPGVENGLKLRLNVEQYEYMPGPHNAAGIKILIHDRFEIPRVYALGQAVSTGANIFAGVQLIKINNLPLPHGQCSGRELDYIDKYSQGGCKLDCLSRTASDKCGCRHIYMPSKNGYPPVCTIQKYYDCLKQMLDDFPSLYEQNCNCPVPCNFDAYDSDISYASTSMFAANKFLGKNVTQQLEQDLKEANEITSRMDKSKLNEFEDLYNHFHDTLYHIEEKLLEDLLNLLADVQIQFSNEFNILRSVCEWKNWLYGYQEYIVEKNFVRPRDAFEERHFHIIALAYTEYILTIENNIRTLNSSDFSEDAVRTFLYQQTSNQLKTRQEVIRRSLINFTELMTAYQTGVGIFNYTYDYAPKSHNDYVVPKELLFESLSHNAYARKYPVRFENYLNRTNDILIYLQDLTEKAYESQNVTEEQMFYGREEFRWLMRNFMYAKSVTYYEVIERPVRILSERHSEFERKCFAAQTVMESIVETVQSLNGNILALNESFFASLHSINLATDQYFLNKSGSKFNIATEFLSGEVKAGQLELENLLQLILKDDSDITSQLDQLNSLTLNIFDIIINDNDSFIYYNFSNRFEFLRSFTDVASEISSNFTDLKAMVQFHGTVGEDSAEFIKSIINLETYFTSYIDKIDINNEFIKENFLQLDIFYKQMSYEEITQQKAYDPFALICDIGGSMGLFLGASLLSMCELLDLVITHFVLPRTRKTKL